MNDGQIKYYCVNCGSSEDIYLIPELVTLYGVKCSTAQYRVAAKCCTCNFDITCKDIYELNTDRYKRALEILKVPREEWSIGKYNGYRIIMDMKCKSGCNLCYSRYGDNYILVKDNLKKTLRDIGKMENVTIVGHNLLEQDSTLEILKLVRDYAKYISMVTYSSVSDYNKIKKLVKIGLDELTLKFEDELACSKSLLDIAQYQKCIPKLSVKLGCSVDRGSLETLMDNCTNLLFRDKQSFDLSRQILSEKNKTYFILPVDNNLTLYKYKALCSYSVLQLIDNPTENDCTGTDIYVTPIGNFSSWDKYCLALGL